MKFRLLTLSAALCLSTWILPRASAQMPVVAEPQSESMTREDWQAGYGNTYTYVYSRATFGTTMNDSWKGF